MTIRRYLAKDMKEARIRIRYELGSDAIIVSSRKVRQKGWRNLFRKKRLEVTAAVDSPRTAPSFPGRTAPSFPARTAPSFPPRAVPSFPNPPAGKIPEGTVQSLIHPEAQPQQLRQPLRQGGREEHLEQEIRELKKRMGRLMEAKEGPEGGGGRSFSACLMRHLKTMDLDDAVLLDIAAFCGHIGNAGMDLRKVKQYFSAYFHRSILREENPEQRIWAFIGPTGVGKTTTIAKIAAREVLKGRSPGLITLDTCRIGAVDQLRTYSDILNIPLEVVSSRRDMSGAVDRLQDCDRILMDSAGSNSRRMDQLLEILACLDEIKGKQTILVVSATTRRSDLKMILENYRNVGYDSIILTKLDETQCYGSILNIGCYSDKPIRYFTVGQAVPEDIRQVSEENLLDYVLKGMEV